MSAPSPRRSRHLMDPANPRPRPAPRSKPRMGIDGVQKWVLSALAVTTILHLAGGLVIFAVSIDDEYRTSQIGLNAIAGVFGMLAVASGFAIHGKSPLNAWALLGLLPAVLGVWLCVR